MTFSRSSVSRCRPASSVLLPSTLQHTRIQNCLQFTQHICVFNYCLCFLLFFLLLIASDLSTHCPELRIMLDTVCSNNTHLTCWAGLSVPALSFVWSNFYHIKMICLWFLYSLYYKFFDDKVFVLIMCINH
jgi:hypothetical protein